ncbi:PP2C family serine/threonine-protein phosphatase [Bradyrhizobium sp. HKCCYLRH1030]|uniref:PP2C family serine/threonine-protein phosphatase n=1 Tax=Bradyrhizobium sp. HKCCYLRH1030 TaxID=3420744 RepID=UPI003EBBB538
MTGIDWEWVSASAVGTSHLRINRGCDDSGACIFVRGEHESALIVVCSDGAGSAQRSSLGARIAVRAFCRNARSFLKGGGKIRDISRDIASDWLDDIRGRIEIVSQSFGIPRREFAATLIGCVIGKSGAKVLHVGDGAAVHRLVDAHEWDISSWPSHGEYASTTYFVTDDPEPTFNLSEISGPLAELAVFTDGIEHLVLNFATKRAFDPFFNQIFSGFKPEGTGRNRNLSSHLSNYLRSPALCEKTDDDKTLLLARRKSHVAP